MNRETESLRENFALILRLKEQAEALRTESDLLLSGMRDILKAKNEPELYSNMFNMFSSLIPYQYCFILAQDKPGFLICNQATNNVFINSQWSVDELFKKVLSGKPTAIFNVNLQPAWQPHVDSIEAVSSVLYCPFVENNTTSIVAFCAKDIGFYTQKHVAIAERYREFTEQTFMAVQAKLKALESDTLRQEKAQVESSMMQSEKMASLGLLAAGVAHEINNPTAYVSANIASFSQYIPKLQTFFSETKKITRGDDDSETKLAKVRELFAQNHVDELMEDLQDMSEECQEGIARVTDIVRSLQSFTQDNDADVNSSFSINECIDNSLRLLRSRLKHEVIINKTLSPTPQIKGSQGKFNQVLVNLLVNATDAMEHDAQLQIETVFNQYDATVTLSITDNGCGIEPDKLDKIFDPFFTTKPIGQGTGLGLYISYTLIEALGGKISVKSELNIGTTFTITFPHSTLQYA